MNRIASPHFAEVWELTADEAQRHYTAAETVTLAVTGEGAIAACVHHDAHRNPGELAEQLDRMRQAYPEAAHRQGLLSARRFYPCADI